MSFSSTSSKESAPGIPNGNPSNGISLHSSLSEPAVSVSTPISDNPPKTFDNHPKPINGKKSIRLKFNK
jgi:hypothetical protein